MSQIQSVARFVRERPYASTLVIGSAVAGAVAGAAIPIDDLELWRRTIGGALAGAFFALFPLGFRLFD